jgi:prepilin-type processing-associated H-X9-DG protein
MGYYDNRPWGDTSSTDWDTIPALTDADIPKPAETVLIGDMTPSVTFANFEGYLTPDGVAPGTKDKRHTPSLHSGGANYAFVDGHVKFMTQDYAFGHPELFTRFDD